MARSRISHLAETGKAAGSLGGGIPGGGIPWWHANRPSPLAILVCHQEMLRWTRLVNHLVWITRSEPALSAAEGVTL